MTDKQQNVVCLVILLVVGLWVFWLNSMPAPEPTGLLSLNEQGRTLTGKKTLSAEEVTIYKYFPVGAKIVGELTAEMAIQPNQSEEQLIQKIQNYARERAAAIGANGVVVQVVAQRGEVVYFAGAVILI